jgi:hypothetical protein
LRLKGFQRGGNIVVHDFIEPVAVTDIFASGIARVEPLGNGLVRLTFYARRQSICDDMTYGEVVNRVVIPIKELIGARPAVDIAAKHVEGAVGDILVTRGRLEH